MVQASDIGMGLDNALEATVDTQEWRLEVERVLPSLKIHLRQDNRVSLQAICFSIRLHSVVCAGLERTL